MANKVTKHIPNTITCLNLFSGCICCVMAIWHMYEFALLCIIFSAIFDFFDGLAARVLDAHSIIGKDIDSLADDISFGLAPAMMVFAFLKYDYLPDAVGFMELFPFIAFLIAVFSALRLAKFNNDSRQTTSFYGLPVPANALFWGASVTGLSNWMLNLPLWIIIFAILLSCWLLVSELPMFSLKFKNLTWTDNKLRFVFLAISVVLLFFSIPGIALIILWYIALSAGIWMFDMLNPKVK